MDYKIIAEQARKRIYHLPNKELSEHWTKEIYSKSANELSNFPKQNKLKKLAIILYKNDDRGKNVSKWLSLRSAYHALSKGGGHNGFEDLTITELKNNKEKTGSICGCVEGCCAYCYTGA